MSGDRPDAPGLREAVEALIRDNERTAPGTGSAVDAGIDAADRAWRADLRALLAASHALTTADERAHLAEQTSREES